ncbi:sialate O-acetylesterase [Luteolibacter sp. Populi]|uniref:sialate O-acetylesterase n=1 Tax=Luteolibacter sp. Populi TaxID=3230487 RepID=UPI003465CD17
MSGLLPPSAFIAGVCALLLPLHAAELKLTSPLDYQVTQRSSMNAGLIPISGSLTGSGDQESLIEACVIGGEATGIWRACTEVKPGQPFSTVLGAPAGAWFQVKVRAILGTKVISEVTIEHVGVGEVFIVAGQSNSANHGEEKQATTTGMVSSFDGTRWQLANDPQPGASGEGGSFMPPLGDALAKRFGTPVGFIPRGIGATSVREWLPASVSFPAPPTLLGRVTQLPDGSWTSNGKAFEGLVALMKSRGQKGFRAVLWHQGESDANQADPTRTLPGELYRQHLETIIRDSRRQIAWEAPWFVAQASYHIPGDEASPDIRAAQASFWKDNIALQGPDSDALKGELRENGGKGVHFSGKGLREHAAAWETKIAPWLQKQLE